MWWIKKLFKTCKYTFDDLTTLVWIEKYVFTENYYKIVSISMYHANYPILWILVIKVSNDLEKRGSKADIIFAFKV